MAAIALLAAALLLAFYAWALSRRPSAPPAVVKTAVVPATYPVVIATHLLPAGAPIAGGDLRVVMLPVRPSGAFAEPSLVAQRVPLADIGANVPVLEAELSSGFAEQVAPGERAVAIHVDEAASVGERVRPGNFVDVFLTLKRDGMGAVPHAEIAQSQTRLLLSRVRVLAFGTTASGVGNPSQFGLGARTAVLAVPTADVDRLALADSAGHILLALRNPRDEEGIAPNGTGPGALRVSALRRADDAPSAQAAAGVSLSELAHEPAPVRTPPRARATRTYAGVGIEVIRGGQAQTLGN
jgi:pilus assembly protein CpaB